MTHTSRPELECASWDASGPKPKARRFVRTKTKTEICPNVGGSTKRRDSLAPIRMAMQERMGAKRQLEVDMYQALSGFGLGLRKGCGEKPAPTPMPFFFTWGGRRAGWLVWRGVYSGQGCQTASLYFFPLSLSFLFLSLFVSNLSLFFSNL